MQYNIAKSIVEANRIGMGLGYIDAQDFASLSQQYSDDENYYVVKSHTFIPEYRGLYRTNQALALFTYRDIRDVALSLTRKYSKPFYRVLLNGEIPEIIENDDLWSNIGGTRRSGYEDFITDLERETICIAEHLHISPKSELINQIVQENSMDAQRRKIADFEWSHAERYSSEITYMPQDLFHPNHIQSGKVNEWREAFSPLQIILIELLTNEWLVKNGYNLSHPRTISVLKPLGKLLSAYSLQAKRRRHPG